MICPRCGDNLWIDKNEPYCSTCGWHDWDGVDFKKEVFWGVHYQGQATRRDGNTRKIWEWDQFHRQTHISLRIEYLEIARGRNGTKTISAQCMFLEGWPDEKWSRYNTKIHHEIRGLFKRDTGLLLKGLEAALETGLRPSTRTS